MDGLQAWVASHASPWAQLAEWSQPETRWRLLGHTALYVATSVVLMLICAHKAALGERIRAAAAARAGTKRASMGPTPAAQESPPQTPAELAEPSSRAQASCTEGIPIGCSSAGFLCHRRTSSWESVSQHLKALGDDGWLRSGSWTTSTGAETIAALAQMSKAQVGELQRFLSSRMLSGGADNAASPDDPNELAALRAETARLQELASLRGTEAMHLRHQLGHAELEKQQLMAKNAASEACRTALERRWRLREDELVTEVANATSTTIRTEARAGELEEELGNLQVRMAVMAADTSRVAAHAGGTGSALTSVSSAITQVAAGMAWLEDMLGQADARLRQLASQRDAAAAAARAARQEAADLRAALDAASAARDAQAAHAARLAAELEATVADFAAYEADVLLRCPSTKA